MFESDHAEGANGVITHFTQDTKPVLIEIQVGREFILDSITSLIKDQEVRV